MARRMRSRRRRRVRWQRRHTESPMRLFIIMLTAAWSSAAASGVLPDATLTPAVVRTDLTQKQMCAPKRGKDHRAVTAPMKRQAFLAYGHTKLNKDPRCP